MCSRLYLANIGHNSSVQLAIWMHLFELLYLPINPLSTSSKCMVYVLWWVHDKCSSLAMFTFLAARGSVSQGTNVILCEHELCLYQRIIFALNMNYVFINNITIESRNNVSYSLFFVNCFDDVCSSLCKLNRHFLI